MPSYTVRNSSSVRNVQIAQPFPSVLNGKKISELWRIAIKQSEGVEILGPWILAPVPQNEEELVQGLLKGIRDK